MKNGVNSVKRKTGLFLREESLSFFSSRPRERGGVLFYIFLAIALLAALTYAFTKDSRDNISVQMANKTAQELYVQVNLIRGAILECTLTNPAGAGDIDGDSKICNDNTTGTCNGVTVVDNWNPPYPLNPYVSVTHTNLGLATWTGQTNTTADNIVRNVSCLVPVPGGTPPVTEQLIFQGINNQGRFLPPPPSGFSEWAYTNDVNGVRISITGTSTATNADTLARLMTKFPTCQADMNYGACGATCFTAWIQRTAALPACP